MPSGSTHDRITLWSLPLVAGSTLLWSHSTRLTLLVSGGFLFSGLMFGPDLDIHSCQYKRWGWLRWLWIPYQKSLPHRSCFSHGPVIGTSLRIFYLGVWALVLGAIAYYSMRLVRPLPAIPSNWVQLLQAFFLQHSLEAAVLFGGLELGAMSHSLSDWSHSWYKRLTRRRAS